MSARRRALFAVGLGLTCAAAVGGLYTTHLLSRLSVESDSVWIVERGASTREIVGDLIDAGAIDAPAFVVMSWLRLTRDRGALRAGEYALERGASAVEILGRIRDGDVLQHRITFAEGLTARQWLAHLDDPRVRRLLPNSPEDGAWESLLGTDGSVEGRLFPNTYQFVRGASDVEILKRAVRQGREILEKQWAERREGLPLRTPTEALILASIVEKETGLAADRARIAQVFINRIERGMRLQSDPTVIYGIADFDGDLRRRDLRRDGPYNTYMRHGLPPTPICNPGLAAIRAVLHPEPGDYLYFVARGDGSSQFSRTLEEHNRAVRRFQLGGRP